ncbi:MULTISPECIES: hypothetical protein [Massilia]|uniref:Uncharacterized protein n=1 Tax=Massilia consociata TaxID=760117 RepID=A0ABV6FLB1_9BURK|nr:hypothetical protein [Massilia varians]
MPKKFTQSAFARMRLQAASKDNITSIVEKRVNKKARVEHDVVKGELLLYWPDTAARHGVAVIDASRLLKFPALANPFANALLNAGKPRLWETSTLRKKLGDVYRYFYSFLDAEKMMITCASDISTILINAYIRWLERAPNGRSSLAVSTRDGAMTTLRMLIDGLRNTPWGKDIPEDLEVRTNIWSGQAPVAGKKASPIPHEDFARIYQTCIKEMEAISTDVRSMREQMCASSNNKIVFVDTRREREELAVQNHGLSYGKVPNIYRNIGLVLATLRHRYPSGLFSLQQLADDRSDPSLAKAISRYHGGLRRVSRCFYPTARDLIPFLNILAIHFESNLETILASNIDDYLIRTNEVGQIELVAVPSQTHDVAEHFEEEDQDAGSYIISRPRKKRAKGRRQVQVRPATDDIDNPASIYKFLIDWTRGIRPLVEPRFRNRLAIFFSACSRSGDVPRGFDGYEGTCGSDTSFDLAYASFFRENNLTHHSFKKFRVTGLDITDVLFSGDIRAKQAAGNHTDPDVTYKSYTTGNQMARGDEVLGEVRLLNERWRISKGKIDPRKKPPKSDLGSATPGWQCVDPFDSPIGQKDKLCDEYGQCPICPHGSLDLSSPYACAQAYNLLAAIDEASGDLAPQAWLERWLPIKNAILELWLPEFSNDVYIKAREYRLNPLPPLE